MASLSPVVRKHLDLLVSGEYISFGSRGSAETQLIRVGLLVGGPFPAALPTELVLSGAGSLLPISPPGCAPAATHRRRPARMHDELGSLASQLDGAEVTVLADALERGLDVQIAYRNRKATSASGRSGRSGCTGVG